MIEKLKIEQKVDNSTQKGVASSLPSNEKYTAEEWNRHVNKTNEIILEVNKSIKALPESDGDSRKIMNMSGNNLNPDTATEDSLDPDDAFVLGLDSDGNPHKMHYSSWFGKGSGLAAENQTIQEGVVREIVVNGRLDIKNLEEKEEDAEFSKKIVINDDGTLAKRIDSEPTRITLNVPDKVAVNHIYPDIANPTPYQNQVAELFNSLNDKSDWQDVGNGFWSGMTKNQIEPEALEILSNGRAFKTKSTPQLKSIWLSDKEEAAISVVAGIQIKNGVNFALKFKVKDLKSIYKSASSFISLKTSDALEEKNVAYNTYDRPTQWFGNEKSTIGIYDFYLFKVDSILHIIEIQQKPTSGDKAVHKSFALNPELTYTLTFENAGWDISNTKIKQA